MRSTYRGYLLGSKQPGNVMPSSRTKLRTGTFRSFTLGSKYLAGGAIMPPDIQAAFEGYPDRQVSFGMGDDGYGNCYMSGDDEALAGIFGSIKKAVSGAAKGVASAVKTVATKVVAPVIVTAAKVGTKIAPVVGLIPGVGTIAGGVIGGASGLITGIAQKKKIGNILLDTVTYGGEGAASGFANQKLLGGKGVIGLGQKVGGLFKGKTPEQQAVAKEQQYQADVQKKAAKEQQDYAKAQKKAADAAAKAAKAQQDAADKAAKAAQKKDKLSAKAAEQAMKDAAKAADDALRQQDLLDQLAKQGAQIVAAIPQGSSGGGGGGGPTGTGGGAGAAIDAATQPDAAPLEAGMMSGMPGWVVPVAGLGLILMASSGHGRRRAA